MNRQDFINGFHEYYATKEINHTFSVDVNELNESQTGAKNYLKPFLLSFHKIKHDTVNTILSNTPIEVDFDWDYSENEEDEEYDENICRFDCKVNLHQLYDQFVLQNNFDLLPIAIYRIEDSNKKGLYNSFFASLSVHDTSHPSPTKDKAFIGVFEDSYKQDINLSEYKRTWSFAFSSLKDVSAWLLEEGHCAKLKEKGFFINKITLPTAFVIEGHKQCIFKREHIILEQPLDLSILKTTPTLKIK